MKLNKYRVRNFRSVKDSGWLEVDDVTSLIGVNESGKTNLLLPLWKFRPAQEGEIIPTADYPKKLFGEIRDNPAAYCFIETELDCSSDSEKLAQLTGYPAEQMRRLLVAKHYDKKFRWSLPDAERLETLPASEIFEHVESAKRELESSTSLKGEGNLREELTSVISAWLTSFKDATSVDATQIKSLISKIRKCFPAEVMKTSVLIPRCEQLFLYLNEKLALLARPVPNEIDGVWAYILSKLPKFVYYSNYGNLDSEIYLPHVVENLTREDLGAKESSKARTLKVLFKFVRLEPQEILELGQEFEDPADRDREPTSEEVEEIAIKKKERSILLQSASSKLTEKFREWWKQGDYRFRFEADGNHFRIWVSDDLRPEEIELENRSTGLQWFLSFYLVFLVESMDSHSNAFLLLDEPGLSLHPLAQRDLSDFFDNLAQVNQLIYTTHSPFLIDADRLDRARKVFVNETGTTEVSPDLRAASGRTGEGASYAVYSALNLSIAESLLLGCTPIIVEGASDQHYLTTIKSLLIGSGKISPSRELVFPPSGGVKTAKSVASMLGGKAEELPKMFLDGDGAGSAFAENAIKNLYSGDREKIKLVTDFGAIENGEIEDLFPKEFLAECVDRVWRQSEKMFQDNIDMEKPIVDQIENWAAGEDIELVLGWKVDLSKEVKRRALDKGITSFDDQTIERWKKIFDWFAS
jgi:AAA ATPase-like protein